VGQLDQRLGMLREGSLKDQRERSIGLIRRCGSFDGGAMDPWIVKHVIPAFAGMTGDDGHSRRRITFRYFFLVKLPRAAPKATQAKQRPPSEVHAPGC
jgi:hypothetical protein